MSDISVTAANVIPAATASLVAGTFGATVTQGKSVYLDASDNKWKLADANLAGAVTLGGVAMNSGSDGQPARILTGGDYNPGATVVVGTIYCLSATAGGICPAADLTTGMTTNVLGVATSASNIRVGIIASGAVVP